MKTPCWCSSYHSGWPCFWPIELAGKFTLLFPWTKFLANSIFPKISGVSCVTDQTPLGLPNALDRQATQCQAVGGRMYFCPSDCSEDLWSVPLDSFPTRFHPSLCSGRLISDLPDREGEYSIGRLKESREQDMLLPLPVPNLPGRHFPLPSVSA